MKKWTVLLLTMALIACLCACGSSKQETAQKSEAQAASEAAPAEAAPEEEAPAEEPAAEEPAAEEPAASAALGGWTLNGDVAAAALPQDAQEAFDKATEGLLGNDLTPVALLGTQVVAGTNYAILCKSELVTAEPVVSYQVAIIYRDLEGNAEIIDITDFNVAGYTEGDGADISAETLAGGWQVPEEYTVVTLPENVQAAFDKALEGWTGSNQEPLAYLASQVVSGTNYAILCRSTLVTKEPVSGISVVTIYEDLQGNAKISNIHVIDPAEFNQPKAK